MLKKLVSDFFLKLKGICFLIGKQINFHGMMRKIFYDQEYLKALKIEEILRAKGWIYIGSGKDRRVWKKRNVVLKIAYTESGVLANKQEDYVFHNFKNDEIRYAPCRLVSDNILMMTAVSPLDEDDLDPVQLSRMPKWAFDLMDGPQVGISKDGRILAYDYGEEKLEVMAGGNRAPSHNGG
jgi:hypothetical protein